MADSSLSGVCCKLVGKFNLIQHEFLSQVLGQTRLFFPQSRRQFQCSNNLSLPIEFGFHDSIDVLLFWMLLNSCHCVPSDWCFTLSSLDERDWRKSEEFLDQFARSSEHLNRLLTPQLRDAIRRCLWQVHPSPLDRVLVPSFCPPISFESCKKEPVPSEPEHSSNSMLESLQIKCVDLQYELLYSDYRRDQLLDRITSLESQITTIRAESDGLLSKLHAVLEEKRQLHDTALKQNESSSAQPHRLPSTPSLSQSIKHEELKLPPALRVAEPVSLVPLTDALLKMLELDIKFSLRFDCNQGFLLFESHDEASPIAHHNAHTDLLISSVFQSSMNQLQGLKPGFVSVNAACPNTSICHAFLNVHPRKLATETSCYKLHDREQCKIVGECQLLSHPQLQQILNCDMDAICLGLPVSVFSFLPPPPNCFSNLILTLNQFR